MSSVNEINERSYIDFEKKWIKYGTLGNPGEGIENAEMESLMETVKLVCNY